MGLAFNLHPPPSSPSIWIGLGSLVLLLWAFPSLDLAVSGLFYTPGAGFTLKGTPWERALHESVAVLMVVVNPALITLWWFNRRLGRRWLNFDGRKLAFLLCLLILVPGLIVNQGLKGHWGRARPVTVVEFGGDKTFTPAFVPSDQGGGSFCSGHVAAAAYLVAVAATLAGPSSAWVWIALIYTLAIGVARLVAGGHFLSDVLTSLLLVWFGYRLLGWVFFRAGRMTADGRDR
ncbi:phosphatase PAP2 family protein [Thermochromatium tepidum]|jgi:PAP2 (acid phosphatase) superfamily protein|uniref:Phosphatase PAP2 family protein n=1 Tax=Thermochromatium tepidum ATCC 43061 TaxID=316276 RepID=A0A6I6EJZ9_THETI|nr:phosphatase PAP2 family protein [Thermochromatium tepidum]QGU33427.1 phosphatase PAP2 family protein [Thermochromatium tepidum ATCC 43061]